MKKKFIYVFSLLIANVTLGQELYSLVDTKIGSKDNGLESGYTFIGSTYPFGMVQFTPSFFSPNKGFVITQIKSNILTSDLLPADIDDNTVIIYKVESPVLPNFISQTELNEIEQQAEQKSSRR